MHLMLCTADSEGVTRASNGQDMYGSLAHEKPCLLKKLGLLATQAMEVFMGTEAVYDNVRPFGLFNVIVHYIVVFNQLWSPRSRNLVIDVAPRIR